VNHLNTKGYKTKKNNHFGINSIKTILENPTYAGYIRWGKHMEWTAKRRAGKQKDVELIKGDHEPIISEELWERVKVIGFARKDHKNTSNFEGEFLLSGILKCPKCGNGMVMSKSKMRNGKGYYLYYQCQTFHQKGLAGCNSNLVTKDIVEKSVLQKINNLFLAPDIVEGICQNLENERDENIHQYVLDLKILRLELNDITTEEVKFKNKLRKASKEEDEEGELSYKSTLSEIVKEKEELEKKIEGYEIFIQNHSKVQDIDKDLILEALKNFHDLFEIGDHQTKKQLLKSLIKKIEMESDRKTIKSITF
jgi:site-specific DNA recombinase